MIRIASAILVTGIFCPAILSPAVGDAAEKRPPNIVIFFADDLGYGDLGCYGHPNIRTPNLDRMADEGLRFTQFYSAANVCTPSRAALLTGRLPIRNGLCGNRRVLFSNSSGGIQPDEITLAEALRDLGYATACIGKWHLGHLPEYLPTRHGFDYYFGIPYSNDMRPTPLMRNEETIEEPAVQETLTRRYTDEALKYIRENADRPFFLYVPYTFPHTPLHASDAFRGRSPRGLYGDVVEELDSSVGEILAAVREANLAEQTFAFFSSDNGPWLIQRQNGGSAGLLREGKGTSWEGGMRVPGIAWHPGTIPAGTVSRELAATMDIFVSSILLAGGTPPEDRTLDGYDIREALAGAKSPRAEMFFYDDQELVAVRKGPWKLHIRLSGGWNSRKPLEAPLLYHLEHDPSERFDLAKDHPEVVAELSKLLEVHRTSFEPADCQLTGVVKMPE